MTRGEGVTVKRNFDAGADMVEKCQVSRPASHETRLYLEPDEVEQTPTVQKPSAACRRTTYSELMNVE